MLGAIYKFKVELIGLPNVLLLMCNQRNRPPGLGDRPPGLPLVFPDFAQRVEGKYGGSVELIVKMICGGCVL